MLNAIRIRIAEVEKKYRACFDTDGPSKTKNGAAVNRARCLKELRTLKLLEYLLLRCSSNITMDDVDLCAAFDQLTEPRGSK